MSQVTARSSPFEGIDIEVELVNCGFYEDIINQFGHGDFYLNQDKLKLIKVLNMIVDKLPSNLREFVSYRYYNDLTMEETAERMNISLSTCYRYRRRLIKKFDRLFNALR